MDAPGWLEGIGRCVNQIENDKLEFVRTIFGVAGG
jgi:hypothetical protein